MIRKSKTRQIRKLYNPTDIQMDLVGEIAALLKGKGWNGARFDNPFNVGGLKCVGIELEDTPTYCLVKWQPNFQVSRTADPCCSAFILTPDELRTIIAVLKEHIKAT